MFFAKPLYRILIIGLLLVAANFAAAVEIQKSPYDKRQYESFTLGNGLRVFLVSDPDLEQAAASLNVQVGSFHEPQDRLGLAHFLEHMLFMGTQKYPDAAEYSQYVSMHGGYTNAWTAPMNTQYYFTIMPQYLPGALDRFAQFFIAPNFNADLVDRERNAVHSEYQLHLKEDGWRMNTVASVTGNAQHPIAHFHIGSRETLGDDGHKRKVRDELLEFYHAYYSADRMILVIAAPQTIPELKSLVTEYFSAVPKQTTTELEFATPAYTANETAKVISAQTIGDHQLLQLDFPLPTQYKNFDKQSLAYILYLINQAGVGGLHEHLKAKNWIVGMQTNAENITYSQDGASVMFSLTAEGVQHIDAIIAEFFSYITFLRTTADNPAVFNDLKAEGERSFMYPEMDSAETLVTTMPEIIQHYPEELVLKATGFSKDTQFDPEHIRSVLGYFSPKNMRVLLANNQVQGKQFEPYFQVSYTVEPITSEQLALWEKPANTFKYTLPKPNPYMPQDFKQKTYTKTEEIPAKVLAKPGVNLWFKQDHKFNLPKENILMLFAVPDAQSTAQKALLQEFMLFAMRDKLHTIGHDLLLAGVSAQLDLNQQGLILSLNMFSDKELLVLKHIVEHIKDYRLNPQRFAAYKEEIGRSLANYKQKMPYRQAILIVNSLAMDPNWLPEELLTYLPEITQESVEAYTQEFLRNVQLEILMHGNITQPSATKVASKISQYLRVNRERKQNQHLPELIKLNAGNNFVYSFNPAHDDSTVVTYMQAPRVGDQAIAMNALLTEIIRVPIFEQLRTNEQLGYIVGVSVMRVRAQPGLLFFIESPERKPDYLHGRIMEFCKNFDTALPAMPTEEFTNFKKSLQHNLLKQPTTLSEETVKYWDQILAGTYRFDFNEQIAKQVESLELPQVANFYHEMWLNPNTYKQINVVSQADQAYPIGEPIDNIAKFKQQQVYN